MIGDLKIGIICDHIVIEILDIPVVNNGYLEFNLRRIPDWVTSIFILYRNRIKEEAATFSQIGDKKIRISGVTYNPDLYPPDDWELEYKVRYNYCPKCKGGNFVM